MPSVRNYSDYPTVKTAPESKITSPLLIYSSPTTAHIGPIDRTDDESNDTAASAVPRPTGKDQKRGPAEGRPAGGKSRHQVRPYIRRLSIIIDAGTPCTTGAAFDRGA